MQNVYVMSDVHGCFYAFKKMLKQINFTDDDLLIIAGDVIDRGGHNNLKIIDYILEHKNIILVRGNHEEFFLRYDNKELAGNLYYKFGGKNTISELSKMSVDEYLRFRNFLNKTPLYYEINVNGIDYTVCHNGYNLDYTIARNEKDEILLKETIEIQYASNWFDFFCSSDLYTNFSNKFSTMVIAGHTPVQNIDGCNEIIITKRYIDLDCGATYNGGRLACLRLNDFEKFYQDITRKDLQ